MNEFRTLAFISKFNWLFRKMGIDYTAMETILRMKLTMDGRRVPTIFNEVKKKKEGNQFLKSLWIYGLYGLMLLPFLFNIEQYIFQMSVVFGITMFILTTTMVSDFSVVLLDVRDRTVLQTKPISSRTIAAAKTIHILIYMFFVTSAFIAIPFMVSLFTNGIVFTLIFLIELLFMLMFIIVFTSLVYITILRFFDGEKLKDIINYVQILLTVGVVIGYQLVIRSFQIIDFELTYSFSWWHLLLPPMWFGAPFDVLLNKDFNGSVLLLAVMALLIPILAMIVYVRMIPSFERNMEKLMSATKSKKQKSDKLDTFWLKLLCRNREEKVFFRFSALMMKQEREFKLKVYPALGFSFILPFIFIFTELQTRSLAEISRGNMFFLIYFSALMIPVIVNMLRYSANYKGSWIFKASPIRHPKAAYSGTLKAFFVKLYIPVFLLLSIIFVSIFGVRIVPHLLAVLLGAFLQTVITYRMMSTDPFPFMNSSEKVQSESSLLMFLLNLLAVLFVVVHLIANSITGGIYFYLALLVVTNFIGWRMVFRRG
ncbi:hypothetical protein QT711_08190 [Sporosarcina saromensis]|uniref:ABC-2 type transport system permease protein n=1 Tax=Sporosarcina saromensis TaxID=359365 RepID=A0ABU4G865_9BACL|nr:hypothetical protein [Sporosarcina saromensis]MDW0113164.1 hypothetical protein [Sporosarcina saromensis]